MINDDFNKINILLKENSNVINFIKDYILRFRFSDIACHSITESQLTNKGIYASTEDVVKDYESAANVIINEYNNKIKKLCSIDNIKSHCESYNLIELKTDIDKEKKVVFDRIISLYNGIDKFRYTSGLSSDFMISNLYTEYILSDNFVYDDENPYVVELLYDIENFLNIRNNIENTTANINQLVAKFNKMCDNIISQYWTENEDYYNHIKKIFQYDFYNKDSDDLIESNINHENRVTLYSKVLDYLKTLVKYTQPVNAEEKYKNANISDLISGVEFKNSYDEENNENILKILKKIALQFTYLKKLESNIDIEYFKRFVTSDNPNIISTTHNDSVSTNLSDYIGDLKSITENESRILKELSNRAINWYLNNTNKIDNGTIFDEFTDIIWPTPSIIYKDGIAHDFYFIEEPENIKEQKSSNRELLNNYEFTEDSLITQYGIDTYEYWVRYCTIATLTNCMLPMYWGTGLIVFGIPVPLPIIFIPMKVISGRITIVIGLGICGICPTPMIYFINLGDLPGSLIPSLNGVVDVLRKSSGTIMESGNESIQLIIKKLLKENDNKINNIIDEIAEIDRTITNLSNGIKEDRETLRLLQKRTNRNSTTNKKKNGE